MNFVHYEEDIQEGFEYYPNVEVPSRLEPYPYELDSSAATPVCTSVAQEAEDTNWPYWPAAAQFTSTGRVESVLPLPEHTLRMLHDCMPTDGLTSVYTSQPSVATDDLSCTPWFACENGFHGHPSYYSQNYPSDAQRSGGEFGEMGTAVAIYSDMTVMVPTAMGHARSSEIPSAANSAIQVSVPRNPLPPSGDDSPIVPQRIYRAKNKMRTQKQISIRFEVNGQPGILLTDARDDRLQGLLDAGKLVFDATNIGKKVCYRIEWPGYPSFNRHKYARRKKGGSHSVMLAEVAKHVAEVMSAFMKENVEFIPDNEYMSWRVGEGYITVDRLRLLELKQVSAGSFQPVLAVTA